MKHARIASIVTALLTSAPTIAADHQVRALNEGQAERWYHGCKCTPHYAMGMVGVVVVGAPVNLASAQAAVLPPLVKRRLGPLLAAAR